MSPVQVTFADAEELQISMLQNIEEENEDLSLIGNSILAQIKELLKQLAFEDTKTRIRTINAIRKEIHKYSPFASEPVDCIQWVPCEKVIANDYNPNTVAPPEMRLLEVSIGEDGYTQPIVAWKIKGGFEVVDGFHRKRVGTESTSIRNRVLGHLPLAVINSERQERSNRIAATIRHNRARGKHRIDAMSDIVVELKRRNWTDERICRELGMDQDEVLRLCQISGLAELFSDTEFSKAWDVEGVVTESDFKEFSDDISAYGEEATEFRTVNTSDETRIFHTYDKWECYKAGFYNTTFQGMNDEQCERTYRDFLADADRFADALDHVIHEWKHSCEHYLTNIAMNRIAWLGQAALCYATGIPSTFRNGFNLLTMKEQDKANELALNALNTWMREHNRPELTMDEALSAGRQTDIY